jgi:uncharacterized RDD family membrane protein YckC
MNDEYYILEGEEKKGPYTYNELIDMDITIHTEIITGDGDTPQYASELPELNDYFEAQNIYFPTLDNLATFGKRTLAFIIDYIPLYIIVETIETRSGFVKLPTQFTFGQTVPIDMLILSASFTAIFFIYKVIFEATALKGTLGKKAMNLIVVDIDGKGLSLGRSLVRNLGVVLSITIWIPFLSMFFSEHRQQWYDNLAKTYVVTTDKN